MDHRSSAKPWLDVDERKHRLLAYHIHDGLCQHLVAASNYLEMTGDSLADDPQQARELLKRAATAVRDGLDEARRIVVELRRSSATDGFVFFDFSDLPVQGQSDQTTHSSEPGRTPW